MNVFGGRSRIRTILCLAFAVLLLGGGATSRRPQARADAGSGGDPIAVSDQWGVDRQVWQDPTDGHLTLDLWGGPHQAPSDTSSTGWAPLNLSLQPTTDGYSPDTADAQVTFSDGSDDSAPVATLAQNDASLSVGLDTSGGVPPPTIEGDTATYPGIAPGVDATLTATAAGFETTYLVQSADSAPQVLDIPLQVDGLTATLGIDGSLILTDSTGTQVGGAEPAQM